MRNNKLILFFSFSLLIGLLWISPILAQEEEYVDPNVPESWYEAPQSASEIGIEEFQQSPVLDEKVEMGELATVEERLPKDPPVIEPYEKVGEYGGTASIWDRSIEQWALDDFSEATALRVTVDGKKIIPSHIKEYEYTDDYKGLTFHLYEGMKWSNGDDFTSEDYLYWWEYEANNEDLTPVPPENWNPPLVDVTAEDKWTVTFHYDRAVPNAHLGF
ncbi:MAG: ABC transporter substrate-binding protein, partial [Bacillota bacterium]